MNTAWNSRPLAECTVINCTASAPSPAWPSPDSSAACARNAASGSVGSASPRAGRRRRLGATRGEIESRRAMDPLFLHEHGRGVHQLVQILDPIGAVALGAVVRDEAARFEQMLDDFGQAAARRYRCAASSMICTKPPTALPALPVSFGAAAHKRRAAGRGRILQLLDRTARRCRASGSSPRAGTRCRPRGWRSGADRRARV